MLSRLRDDQLGLEERGVIASAVNLALNDLDEAVASVQNRYAIQREIPVTSDNR